MNATRETARLQHDAGAIEAFVAGVDDEQWRWKPSPNEWSLLEVIGHLHDEEREDFRTRVDILLQSSGAVWPPIHPGAWVTERRYNEREPDTALRDFLRERESSVAWLRSLASPDWSSSGQSPWGDIFTAGQMLACWVAHDMLHLRQLAELHYRYIEAAAAPASVDYAGGW